MRYACVLLTCICLVATEARGQNPFREYDLPLETTEHVFVSSIIGKPVARNHRSLLAELTQDLWSQVNRGPKLPDITSSSWKMFSSVPTLLIMHSNGRAEVIKFPGLESTRSMIGTEPYETFHKMIGDDLYTISSDHTYVSHDSGTSWQINEQGLTGINAWNDIAIDNEQNVFLGTNAGLYKQPLQSTNWSKIESAGEQRILQVFIDRMQRIWIKSDSWLKLSSDGGQSFEDAPEGLGFAFFARFADDALGNVYVITGPSNFPEAGNAVFKSAGGIGEFERIDTSIAPLFLKADPKPYVSIAGGGDSIWLGTVGGAFLSTDQGETWAHTPKLNAIELKSLIPQGSNGLVATTTGIFRRLSNFEWEKTYPDQGFASGLRLLSDETGSRQYLIASKIGQNSTTSPYYMIYRSTDYGATWSPDTVGGSLIGMTHLYADANGDLHAAGHTDVPGIGPVIRAWKKPWDGKWSLNMSGIPEDLDSRFALQTIGGGGSATYLSFQNTNEQRSIIFRQQVGGGTWENYTSFTGSILGFSGAPLTHAVATSRGVGHFNAGISLMPLPEGIAQADLSYTLVAAAEGGRTWAWFETFDPILGGGGSDIYYTDDKLTWKKSDDDLDSISISQLVASGDSLFVISQARGVFVVHANPSGAVRADPSVRPLHVMPNPASGTVRIIPSKYQRGEATVHVIAVTGVRVLAVTRQIDAESFDLDVSGLAAGIYRVDVTLGDELYSTKLVIE